MITVSLEFLRLAQREMWDGEVLTLNGHRYQSLRPDPRRNGAHLFGLIREPSRG